MKKDKPKIILIIMDGWGIAPSWGGNAISIAQTPFFDMMWRKYPRTSLFASGVYVGLTGNESGNSEVGHLNIGAGRILEQSDKRILKSIADKSFYKKPAFLEAIENCKKNNSNLHLLGLLSVGKVHSDIEHLFALIDTMKLNDFNRVFIHIITDGRDTPPMSAQFYLEKLENKIKETGAGQIATVSGRFYAMDRDKRWPRTELAYRAIAEGIGNYSDNPRIAISGSYSKGITDEFIRPTIVRNKNKHTISNKDSVIFFNFRADRARQLTESLVYKDFSAFTRNKVAKDLFFVTMTPYEYDIPDKKVKVAFEFENEIKNTISEVVSKQGMRQLHIAETEKYAHVTYFFDGGNEKPFLGQDNIIIPSPKVATYDQSPEMSADKITNQVIEKIDKYDFVLINYANCDMVGHSGNLEATIRAVETVDKNIEKVCQKNFSLNGVTFITADHGNAEEIINPRTLETDTEHSSNPVPLIVYSKYQMPRLKNKQALANISPSILHLLNIQKPQEMTSDSLFEIKNE